MTEPVPDEDIAAALAYESLHVPALFQQWTSMVLDRVEIAEGDHVLDVACGTGVLARAAASRCGSTGSVSGLDASPGMLAVAEQLAPEVSWQQGSAESLPYASDRFDAVVSQFGLMFFGDRQMAIREMLRVLVPGRRLAIAVWDALENSEAYAVVVELLERSAGQEAANALRAPFVLGDRKQLASLISTSGGESVEVSSVRGTARFPSIRTMVEADLRGWLPVMGVTLGESLIEHVLQRAETVLSAYVTTAGSVEFDSPALIVTARAPIENQDLRGTRWN